MHELEQAIAAATVELLREPELSCLPIHNREDIVASIAFTLMRIARAANPDRPIDDRLVCSLTLSLYRKVHDPSTQYLWASHKFKEEGGIH